MLSKFRALWRRSRSLPLAGSVLATVDRLWWARTIRRADVVDLDFVRVQRGGRRLSRRGAVRQYVQGGFRSGFALNPLFLDEFVSTQLPDAERVPALYAYLVADATRVETTIAWSAPAYAEAHPESQRAFGGPLVHAWSALRAGATIALRSGTAIDAHALRIAALRPLDAAGASSPLDSPAIDSPESRVHVMIGLDRRDADGHALTSMAEFLGSTTAAGLTATLEVRRAPASVRSAAALLALADRRVVLSAQTSEEQAPGTLLLRREPGAAITSEALRELQRAAADGPVMPILLGADGTVAAAGIVVHGERGFPLLSGFPAEDVRALGVSIPTAALVGPVTAEHVGDMTPPRVLSTQTTILADDISALDRDGAIQMPGALDSPDLALSRRLVVEGWTNHGPTIGTHAEKISLPDGRVVPRLRWGIKTAAPAGPSGESWGDTHFARALGAALERLGQYAAVDARSAAHRPSDALDDVSLVLRGPHRIDPSGHGLRLLWIISHPDEITAAELAEFDRVFAASRSWSRAAALRFGRAIDPLLQCTDATRFHPTGLDRDGAIVFVGTARGMHRPAVVAPVRAGVPVRVYGPDWRGYIPATHIAATRIPNDELPTRYESAGVVLNDHWPEMKRHGFISNRPYDVLASGGRVISDEVEGIDAEFSGAVVTFESENALVEMLQGDLDALFPSDDELARVGTIVRERDSFDARARTLLEAVLSSR